MKTVYLILLFSFFSIAIFGQTASVTIRISGIEETQGNMSIALYDQAEGFPGKKGFVAAADVAVEAEIFQYTFNDLSYGTYAIAVYHDIDKNGELNSNWIGMPKEPYGFSNNAKGKMGPPDFEDASFEVIGDMILEIILKD